MTELTVPQIEDAIVQALAERCITVIPGLLKLMALKDPRRAQVVLDTLNLGIDIRRAEQKAGASHG